MGYLFREQACSVEDKINCNNIKEEVTLKIIYFFSEKTMLECLIINSPRTHIFLRMISVYDITFNHVTVCFYLLIKCVYFVGIACWEIENFLPNIVEEGESK